MSGDYLWDRRGPRDPEVARLERLLGTLRQDEPPRPLRLPARTPVRVRATSFFVVFAAAAAVIVALVGAAWWIRFETAPGLEVTRLAGVPAIGSQPVTDRRQLRVGRWLDTRDEGRVSIDVGDIGRVELEPRTRLGLLSTNPGDYRLHLARGTMHAKIWAPPGQFFVETSTATAVDLGCAYTMTVDDEGVGTVHVATGWVGFEWRGAESFIPAGAVCRTRPRLGPGIPYFEETSPEFRAAIELLDLGAGTPAARRAAIDRILAEAREEDAFTVWHLLPRVDAADRDRVFDRLAQLVPPPPNVTRDAIRAGDREALDRWWEELGFGSASWWRTWKQQWREK